MSGKLKGPSLNKKGRQHKAKKREEYLRNIQKTLWMGHNIPSLPVEAVADLATELFSSSCGARKLSGLHLPEAVQESCKGRISPCSLVLAMLYLERLKSGGDEALEYLSDVTPSEHFIVSMMVANKFLQDEGDSNEVENWFWSDLSGFDINHINKLEMDFLSAIQWEVFVSHAEFWRRLQGLHHKVALQQGTKRGWFTYEEISALLDTLTLPTFMHTMFQVSAVCLLSYTAAVMTMVGATILSAHLQNCLLSSNVSSGLATPSSDTSCTPPTWPLSWQQHSENDTKEDLDSRLSLDPSYLNGSSYENALEINNHVNDKWPSKLINFYLSPVTTHKWLLNHARQEINLFQLKEII